LKQVVEAKIAGKEVVAPPVSEQVQVLNLMDALKKSVAEAQAEAKPAAAKPAEGERPPKLVAASSTLKPTTKKSRRKSS
jgi:DNA end-binding protein Ku